MFTVDEPETSEKIKTKMHTCSQNSIFLLKGVVKEYKNMAAFF